MRRHSVVARFDPTDTQAVAIHEVGSVETELRFIDGERRLGFGLGQMIDGLGERGIYPTEEAIDLALFAASVTAADTRISRNTESQDSWTREIDLYIPVQEPDLWTANAALIVRTLAFLTGDRWRVFFRARHGGIGELIDRPELVGAPFSSVCLFSGGLDSFVGAIDLHNTKKNPIFVSHYWDVSTSSQKLCADCIGAVFGDMEPRHVRARVGFPDDLVTGSDPEKSTRGRSFLFFALAALAASGLANPVIYVPENGLISLNVPLNPLRLGAWSTRTTHPFYMVRWQELLNNLGIGATLSNPYRFKTKGEMLSQCAEQSLLQDSIAATISCSSVTKARWKGLPLGHCGHCTPCLIRRAAIVAAFGADPTGYSMDDLTARTLDARSAESEHVQAFQLMARRLSRQPGIEHILVHKPGPLSDYPPSDIAEYGRVFRRGIEEVEAIVNDVIVRAA